MIMKLFVNWLLSALAVTIGAYILPGIHIANFVTALVLAVVLGLLNALVKPILLLLTLPLTILTLGLFALIINGIIILLASWFVPGFTVENILWAILFSLVVSVITFFLHSFID